jgi:hypothetical protein
MSTTKNLIMRDHSDKKWLSEDYDQHYSTSIKKDACITVNAFMAMIAVMAVGLIIRLGWRLL